VQRPRIVYTDLNGLFCKGLEEAYLSGGVRSLVPWLAMITRHPPDRAYELEGPAQQLHGLHVVILLPALGIHRGNPPLPGVVDTRIHDEQLIRLLHTQDFVIDQHLHRLPPASLIYVEAKNMESNLTVSPHQACHLTEPEDAAETAGVHGAPFGIPEHHLGCETVDSARVSTK
jgi:hypothetical protein